MIDEEKLKSIISFHKSEKFSFGSFDSMQKAEDIVHAIERYLTEKNEEVLLSYLDGYCPSDEYQFPLQDDDCSSLAHQKNGCKECWLRYLQSS